MNYTATCKLGLEALVADELRRLGAEVVEVLDARVRFSGGFSVMARACLWLRTAERVLMEVGVFTAKSFEELFEGVMALELKPYFTRDAVIHVNGKSAKSALFSVSDCQSITKKAIVENLKRAYRTEVIPETGKKLIVEVGILRDEVTLALDCCGAGLSRRGYRTYNVAAPISETLGAAIVKLSRYHGGRPFIDPMCGSGTMPIEAAMIAENRAPGLNRAFAAEEWPFLPDTAFTEARLEARAAITPQKLNILGNDIDARSVALCKKHAKKAGVMVNWSVADFRDIDYSKAGGVIACNPPYGERMLEKREAERLYRDMHKLFAPLEGWNVNIISSHKEFERIYGARADKRRKLSNGGMTCTLYSYFK